MTSQPPAFLLLRLILQESYEHLLDLLNPPEQTNSGKKQVSSTSEI